MAQHRRPSKTYCPRCWHPTMPSKLLKFPSKSRRTLVSLATWSSTQTKHHSFFFSTMAAKEATLITADAPLPISLSSSIQIINETVCDGPPTHEQVAAVYKLQSFHWDVKQITNKRDDVLIARLWSGHYPSLKQYLRLLILLKIQFAWIAKVSSTGSVTIQLCHPRGNQCLGAIKGH